MARAQRTRPSGKTEVGTRNEWMRKWMPSPEIFPSPSYHYLPPSLHSMDPFRQRVDMEDSSSEASRLTDLYGSSSPPPMSPPPFSSQHVADPFENDHDERDGNAARVDPPAQTPAAEQASVSTLASTSTQRPQPPQQYSRPAQVNAASASLLLSTSSIADEPAKDPNPSTQRPQAQRDAVRMGKMKEVSHDHDQADLSSDNEESRLMLPSTDSKPATQRRRRKPKTHESIVSLASIGRRLLSAARNDAREDEQDRGLNGLRVGTGAGTAAAKDMPNTARLSRREQALWMWANLDSVDDFLKEVYAYYTGKGFVCIALARGLNILTIGFVIGFSTFLFGCIDYTKIQQHGQLSNIIVPQCVSRFSAFGFLAFIAFLAVYGLQITRFILGLKRLHTMHLFFTELLEIPEADIQTIQWHNVVTRLDKVSQLHPLPSGVLPSLDVHQVANRLMRQDNYLIALFNRELLDLSIPGAAAVTTSNTFLTRSLQWNLDYCLLGFLFDQNGSVRKPFLSTKHRQDLIDGLQRRFTFMAITNAVLAPFIVLYLLVYSFFRYFEEYHKNPATLGSRQYTELARWKFREFNELPHLFRRRCHASYPLASRYIEQFPKGRTAIIARFVSFIAGSFTAVLLLAYVIDPEVFTHFEITHQRNVLFYLGVFGAILAASRGMIPDEAQVFTPEVLLEGVNHYTHYCPDHWKGRFHSAEVHAEFGKLYSLKVSIFVVEVLSVLVTPFILWLSLPKNAPAIVDFFRECTVHVDGLGYVCSFAVFDSAGARPDSASKSGPSEQSTNGEEATSRGLRPRSPTNSKLERSVLNFALANDWQPGDLATTVFLEKLQRRHQQNEQQRHQQRQSQRQYTPSASLLEKSQLYDEALERAMALRQADARATQTKKPLQQKRSTSRRPKTDLQAVKEASRDDDFLSDEERLAGFVDPTSAAAMHVQDAARSQSRPKTLVEHVNSLM